MAAFGIYLMGCALLAAAGAAKSIRPGDTARAIAGALPSTPPMAWPHVVRWFAAGEAILGVIGIVHPTVPFAAAVAASYACFSAFVLYARARGGPLATCGCFGTPDTPPTVLHAGINLLVAAGAVWVAAAATSGSITSVLSGQYLDGVPLAVTSGIAAWLAFLVMSPLARLHAIRRAEPYLPGGHG